MTITRILGAAVIFAGSSIGLASPVSAAPGQWAAIAYDQDHMGGAIATVSGTASKAEVVSAVLDKCVAVGGTADGCKLVAIVEDGCVAGIFVPGETHGYFGVGSTKEAAVAAAAAGRTVDRVGKNFCAWD
jgi:hypothetical protein